jgi:hypothetical protein
MYKLPGSVKISLLIFIFSLCAVASLFSQRITTLNALFTEQDAIHMPLAEGEWSIKELEITVSIHKAGDNFCHLNYGNNKNQSRFEAAFIQIGNEYFMDLSGVLPDTMGDEYYRSSFIRGHAIYKVQFHQDTMALAGLKYAWFYDYAVKRKLLLDFEWVGNSMLLTLKTEELKSFLNRMKNEKDIFENFTVAIKKLSKKSSGKEVNKNIPRHKMMTNISQTCIPQFPFKDGWLGGDGDVSVPINKTQTLFIFSDTYVSKNNQRSRTEPGMEMVSNSVAIETCLPNGKTDVHYFWNNMYTSNPGPIFKSYTNRYRYWVNDAFMHKNILYVLLGKIAHKQGQAPDDIFGFSNAGYTLAKVINPSDPPVQWQMEFIPLPEFIDPPMGIRSHAIQENFIYFFVSRNDNAQFLVRKSLDALANPEKAFEYYALNKTWKTGIRADDLDTVISGFRSNTVNYHPELNLWIMVCDIKFFDNNIKIRTSPSLTGPWSEEKIIYECPEITPGTPSYKKSNFCYLSRECIQNYDPKNHTMLITYDINNTEFSEIKSNPSIYTPKVITVSMKNYYTDRMGLKQ